MSEQSQLSRVDHSALRVNQACIITLLIIAFVLNSVWLVLLVAVVMAIGTVMALPGFRPVYASFLKPRGIVKPDVIADNPEPHRFAQGLGSAFLFASVLALLAGGQGLGWALSWLVVALAALNLFGGFCAGCFVYYWLNRMNVPGFVKMAPPNTFPGMRPRQES